MIELDTIIGFLKHPILPYSLNHEFDSFSHLYSLRIISSLFFNIYNIIIKYQLNKNSIQQLIRNFEHFPTILINHN